MLIVKVSKQAELLDLQNVQSRPLVGVADLFTKIRDLGLLPLAEALRNASLSCLNSCPALVLDC